MSRQFATLAKAFSFWLNHKAALSCIAPPGNGTCRIDADGQFVYVPNAVISARLLTPLGVSIMIEYNVKGGVAQAANPTGTKIASAS